MNRAAYSSMLPILFEIRTANTIFGVRSYSVFLAAAIAAALTLGFRSARHERIPSHHMLLTQATSGQFGIAGAFLFHWLFTQRAGGFSVLGGLTAGRVAGYLCCRIFKLDPLRTSDALLPSLGIALIIARLGCFLNGCCFGILTQAPVGIIFPKASLVHRSQVRYELIEAFHKALPVHPTQLYEVYALILVD